jgi:hypothetical protein
MKTGTQARAEKNWQFARVLGKRPRLSPTQMATTDTLQLFVEAFGPPEKVATKKSSMLLWNFERIDGARGFSLLANVPSDSVPKEIDIRLCARGGVVSFCNWTADRLSLVRNGDEAPLFLDGGKFVVAPLN